MSDDAPLLYDVQGHVATLTLNRPEKLNAFHPEMLQLWAESIERAGLDRGVRVVIVTGAGRGFCSGRTWRRRSGRGAGCWARTPTARRRNRNNLRNSVQRVPRALLNLGEAVHRGGERGGGGGGHGHGVAGGHPDRVGAGEVRHGLCADGADPGGRGAYYLPRIVGMAKALELMWTARIFQAEEALAMGYVSRVVSHDEVMAETRELAEEIARMPAVSVQLMKRLAYRSGGGGGARGAGDGGARDGDRAEHGGRGRGAAGVYGEGGSRSSWGADRGPARTFPRRASASCSSRMRS